MIQVVSSYLVGQQLFPTIEEAQKAELADLLNKKDSVDSDNLALVCAESIISHADEVIAILTCEPLKKKPRSDKGKKRGPKAIAQAGAS